MSVLMQREEPTIEIEQAEILPVSNLLMEEICKRENLLLALKRVRQNRGGPGIDGMSIKELGEYLKEKWPEIKESLLSGRYVPSPVKRVEIQKREGGKRKLGIPTVLDRFIQQAILQTLQPSIDRTFSCHSFGFRPGRSAHQALAKGQEFVRQGYGIVVDIDLEKFFDQVNHDKLMSELSKRIKDKRVLKLLRSYLQAGVMEDGINWMKSVFTKKQSLLQQPSDKFPSSFIPKRMKPYLSTIDKDGQKIAYKNKYIPRH